MRNQLPFILIAAVLLSACTSAPLVDVSTPTEIFTNENVSAMSTRLPSPAEMSVSLPRENLLLAVHFHREAVENVMDAACYDVGMYDDGGYIAVSCLPDFVFPAPTGALDANQSKYLRRWVDQFQGFEEPSADGLLVFEGKGAAIAGFSDKASMRAMLGEIVWTAHQYVHRGGTPSPVSTARLVLSNQLAIATDDIIILNFEATDFPDSCLGMPKQDEVCDPVLTQGFRIYFATRGLMYEYHTDIWGYDIRPYGEPQIAPTQGPGG